MSKWERWTLFAWQTALGLVFLAALTMLLWQSRNAPLSVDEGYNLEVVDNLARNGLYASYGNRRLDANWSLPKFFDLQPSNIFKPWLFDPRITTGPVVLLPLALNWALFPGSFLALHAVMVAFFLLGLWATWHLTPEGSGRLLGFFGASALFSTLWFNFRPNAIIGEIPAISLVLWAMVALTGERFFLAGLALGAAIQSKFILLLPTLFGLSLVGFRLIRQGTWQKIAALFAGLTLPTLAFELYRLASLGSLVAWWDSWREFRAFAQEQARAFATESLNKKWFSLSTQGPGEFSVAALLAALGLGHLLQKNLGYKETENDLRVKDALSVGFAIGLSTITLWLCFSNQSSYRQVLPGTFLVFIPLMLGIHWWRLPYSLSLTPGRLRRLAWTAFHCVCLLLFLLHVQWILRLATFRGWREGLKAQVKAAEALKNSGAVAISPLVRWFEPFPFLSGLRMAPCVGPNQALVATLWAHAVEGKSRDEYKSLCSQTIAENRDVLICFPRPDLVTTPAAPLKVKSWGPQETTVGVVPNQQPSGEGAFWFVVESPMPQRPKVLLLLDHQVVDPVTWSADGTWFSALLPRQLVSRPQAIPVRLWDLCRNQTVEAGVFRVQNPQKR